MFKKIVSFGKSLGVIIPRNWLVAMGWELDTLTKLEFDFENRQIIIKEANNV